LSAAPSAGVRPHPPPVGASGDVLLRVSDLATHFFTRTGVVKAVDGVSFDVHAGEIVGLVGESGSGKTMTGFSLLGLIDPPGRVVAGSVRLSGRELVGLPQRELRRLRGRRIAMVFQDPMATLNPVLTIATQIRLAIGAHERVSRAAARARSIEVLTRVGIPDAASRLDAYPHQFSGGMRQRVAIAIALLHRPDLIVADEPTTALDVSIQAQILVEIESLVRDLGTALIWISHDLATVSALAQRLLVMYAGRIVEDGPIGAVLRDPRHPYTRGLLQSLPQYARPGQELAQIPGSPPALGALPAGCAFGPRCPRADATCRDAPERSAAAARGWRCHHPLAGAVA
jgi:peptide/nickel transport system ATP-binding protein